MYNLSAPEYAVFNSKEVISRPEVVEIFDRSQKNPKTIFILEGDRGAGKTTALLEIFRLLSNAKFQPFFIGLSPYRAPEFAHQKNLQFFDLDKERALKQLSEVLETLVTYLNIKFIKAKDRNTQREYLSKQLSERKGDKKPVILIDSIYECEPELRQQIESDILIPLLQLNEVIIILSGRGKRPIWASPEFRNATYISLENFVEEKVFEQLQKMGSKHLNEVQKITQWSGGCPLVVRVLGKAKQVDLDVLNEAINILISDGLRPEYRSEVKEMRSLIEKIALLEPFREVEVDIYLFGNVEDKRSRTKDLVFKLIDSSLLAWDDKSSRRGLKLNETVAHPIQEWLEAEENRYSQYKGDWQNAVEKLVETYPSANKQEYDKVFGKEIKHVESGQI